MKEIWIYAEFKVKNVNPKMWQLNVVIYAATTHVTVDNFNCAELLQYEAVQIGSCQ